MVGEGEPKGKIPVIIANLDPDKVIGARETGGNTVHWEREPAPIVGTIEVSDGRGGTDKIPVYDTQASRSG